MINDRNNRICFIVFIKIDFCFVFVFRSVISHRLDERCSLRDRRGSASLRGGGSSSVTGKTSFLTEVESLGQKNGGGNASASSSSAGRRISNSVQAQIERMFTEVSKDATSCSFPVRCLGSLPLNEKVTSLQGLQEPLRQLYLSGAGHGVSVYDFNIFQSFRKQYQIKFLTLQLS